MEDEVAEELVVMLLNNLLKMLKIQVVLAVEVILLQVVVDQPQQVIHLPLVHLKEMMAEVLPIKP